MQYTRIHVGRPITISGEKVFQCPHGCLVAIVVRCLPRVFLQELTTSSRCDSVRPKVSMNNTRLMRDLELMLQLQYDDDDVSPDGESPPDGKSS